MLAHFPGVQQEGAASGRRPAYLLTNQSPFATIYTGVIFYLAMFTFGLYYLRKNKWYQNLLIVSFFFVTIHPQFIVQNRFVWNPTFIGPLLFLSFFSGLTFHCRDYISPNCETLNQNIKNKKLSCQFLFQFIQQCSL